MSAFRRTVCVRHFEAIGMRLVAGRLLSERDGAASPLVVVVNETMARRAWPGENPIGKRIRSSLSLALGAGSDSVVALVMRQGMTIALAGLAAGVAASLLLTRYLQTMLFGVTGSDPATYLLLATAVVLVSAVACYVTARRATRVDPLTAIRV